MKHIALAVALLGIASSAQAVDICQTVALRDIHAVEDPTSVYKKGETMSAVTQYVKEANGTDAFCSHGGYCYPAHIQGVPVQRLTNCTIDFRHPDKSDDETIYYLLVDRRRNSAHDLRVMDIGDRLLALGASNAYANNMAVSYVDHPNTRCGRFAAKVLAGDRAARREVANGNFPGC